MTLDQPFYPSGDYQLPHANEVKVLTEATLVVDPTMARNPAPQPRLNVSSHELEVHVKDIHDFTYERIVQSVSDALLAAAEGHLIKVTDSVAVIHGEWRPWRWSEHRKLIERRNQLALELQYQVYPEVFYFESSIGTLGLVCSVGERYSFHLEHLLQVHGYNPWKITPDKLFIPLTSKERDTL